MPNTPKSQSVPGTDCATPSAQSVPGTNGVATVMLRNEAALGAAGVGLVVDAVFQRGIGISANTA